jgi:HK97 family phage prohead protease
MKNFYDVKNVSDSVKDVDTSTRRVKVVISRMGNKDLDGDIIQPGAFTKTITERGPQGSNLIWHLTDHYPSLKNAVGKFSELYVEGNDLVGVTNIPNTTWGNDVLEFYKTGHINQHSIGFRTIKREPLNAGTSEEVNSITEILLYEGSSVLWGANPMTPTREVGKSLTKDEMKTEFDSLSNEWGLLMKSLRSGTFTDDTFELIELRINQNQERQKQLFEMFTVPAVEAVQPDEKDEVIARDFSIIKQLI